MTKHLAKRALCGRCEDGWVVDPETFQPVSRCPCRWDTTLTPEQARDRGVTSTVAANPDAMREALAIIRRHALTRDLFSSNQTRADMTTAGIPKNVIGAAFRQAAKDRVIVRDGYEPSLDPGTHAHPVVVWASLIYRPGAA